MTIQLGIALWGALTGTLACIHAIHLGRRDRGKLVCTSFWDPNFDEDANYFSLNVQAVNTGRRKMVITDLVILYKNGIEKQVPVHPTEQTVTLDENALYRLPHKLLHGLISITDKENRAVNLWIKNSHGVLLDVKDSQKTLDQFYGDYDSLTPRGPRQFRINVDDKLGI